jgi:hypothetical protein
MRIQLPLGVTLATVIAFGGLGTAACGGSSPTTPPVVTNTAPIIESLAVASPRAEADLPIQVTAVVKDIESALDRMTYTWSASPQIGTFAGTTAFSGNQASIMWRPPKGQTSPDTYTVTLAVSESYTSGGQPRQNTVSASTTVHYNDSPREALAVATQFIRDFGTFAVSPEQCVRNFSTNGRCADERQQELEQITINRQEFEIRGSIFPAPVATFDNTLTSGTVEGSCTFEDIPKSGPNQGKRQFVSGTCFLTTVYENFRWYLCASNFLGPYNTTVESLRGRVPGRIRFR